MVQFVSCDFNVWIFGTSLKKYQMTEFQIKTSKLHENVRCDHDEEVANLSVALGNVGVIDITTSTMESALCKLKTMESHA